MKGHALLVITGANETTNVSAFAVGRFTAFDPTGTFNFLLPLSASNDPAHNGSPLFLGHETTVYDGVADLGLISITSTDGKFGGIRTADAAYFRGSGLTGINARGVAVQGPVFIGELAADAEATPVLLFGATSEVHITGGDCTQLNSHAVEVHGITCLRFCDGMTACGALLTARANKARFEDDGVDVTDRIVAHN